MGDDLVSHLEHQARAVGFDAFGVTTPDAIDDAGAHLRRWLEAGHHGDMVWMENRADQRASPRALWAETRAIILLGMNYTPTLDPLRHAQAPDIGVISVYALGQDYHKEVKKRLKRLARWLATQDKGKDTGQTGRTFAAKVFVDTAPVMEKPLAAAAGLGWQGKHTNLVNRDHGSWLFLGAIYTNLDLPPTARTPGGCGSCRACLDICPTQAFPAPYQLDARRCISYLTIEHKGPIPLELRPLIGNRIYGCDDCLAICPWNKFAKAAHEVTAWRPRAELTAPLLADILDLDDAAFRSVFAGSPIKRIGRNRMIRNALIAAGNSGNTRLMPHIQRLCHDPDDVVADAARWAADRLDEKALGRKDNITI